MRYPQTINMSDEWDALSEREKRRYMKKTNRFVKKNYSRVFDLVDSYLSKGGVEVKPVNADNSVAPTYIPDVREEWNAVKSDPEDMEQVESYVERFLEVLVMDRLLGESSMALPAIAYGVASEINESREMNLSTAD